jgi:hypothetical protein
MFKCLNILLSLSQVSANDILSEVRLYLQDSSVLYLYSTVQFLHRGQRLNEYLPLSQLFTPGQEPEVVDLVLGKLSL